MQVLVTGAYGFLGRGIVEALLSSGHTVVGAGRDLTLGRALLPDIQWVYTDFNHDLDAGVWEQRLTKIEGGVDAIVNCVGILQSDLRDKADKVHGAGAKALFEGARRAGVEKIVHLSATTLQDEDDPSVRGLDGTRLRTQYGASKLAGEAALADIDLNWTIVRPDLVLGAGSNGGALLMRALAGLPFFIPVPAPGTQKFQPIALDDVSAGVVGLLEEARNIYQGKTLYAVGPEVLGLADIIGRYRAWLGFVPARVQSVPRFLVRGALLVGDFVALFGNRTALRTASLEQMDHFVEHDPGPFQEMLGHPLQSMDESLAQRPASFPDRQHARTAFVWPFLQWVLGLSWMFVGLAYFYTKWMYGLSVQSFVNSDLITDFLMMGSVVLGGLFLSKKWMRVAGFVKIGFVLMGGVWALFSLTSPLQLPQFLLALLLPVLVVALVMGMNEKR